MKGIDIYSGQGNIDFNKVKNDGIEIVYIKATEGVTYTDTTFKSFYNDAKSVDLKVGFYHFLRNNNPIEEAKHFINVTNGLEVDCRYAIDVEVVLGQTSDKIVNNVIQFANYLKSNGKGIVVYTYTSFLKEYLQSINNSFELWIAEYGVKSPNINVPYIGFQYSDSGSVSGINGEVDLDEFSESILLSNERSNLTLNSCNIQSLNQFINGYNSSRVRNLQSLINGLGLKDNSGNSLIIDGIFGELTEQASKKLPIAQIYGYHNDAYTDWIEVQFNQKPDHFFGKIMDSTIREFQRSKGLIIDGKVGIKTLKEILKQP
ncbi:GH25 family lysozyme [Clostridium pasteurianum]|uniref:GH25 family lysozyme n=1 Tax=Clostridium pasteurianum TaxID=1501 RepID=UPI002260BB24|nr:GH25 family lysozyme [Clostridium pasteurianum]UZW12683.1 GH25 family lysozyme [Clostridium pasteurianum]